MVRCTLDQFRWEKIEVCDEADASRDERCSGRGEMAQPLRSVASIPALLAEPYNENESSKP